jgi:hypothetical protein
MANPNIVGSRMRPRVDIITIAVDDPERSLAFYRDGLTGPAREWLSAATLITGIAGLVTVLICQSVLGVLAAYVLQRGSADVSASLYAVFAGIFQAADIPLALFLLGGALDGLAAGAVARWMGAIAAVGAVGFILGSFAYVSPTIVLNLIDLVGLLFFGLFIVSTSIAMLIGRGLGQH